MYTCVFLILLIEFRTSAITIFWLDFCSHFFSMDISIFQLPTSERKKKISVCLWHVCKCVCLCDLLICGCYNSHWLATSRRWCWGISWLGGVKRLVGWPPIACYSCCIFLKIAFGKWITHLHFFICFKILIRIRFKLVDCNSNYFYWHLNYNRE